MGVLRCGLYGAGASVYREVCRDLMDRCYRLLLSKSSEISEGRR